MAAADLTTLAAAKAWLGIEAATTGSDAQLTPLVSAASRFVYSILNRPVLFKHTVTETRDGVGGRRLLLTQFPVLSIGSVTVDGIAIPAAAAYPLSGYQVQAWDGTPPGRAQALDLFGWYAFNHGRQNVAISYAAGYAIAAEAHTVATAKAIVSAPFGPWGQDDGVTYANGTALTRVAGAPSVGQYQLDATTPGQYNFNSADNAAAVLISYSYVPADLSQVATELVGERWKYKGRIGEVSKSLGGQETVSFSQKDLNATMRLMLQNYINVVPF